MHSAMSIFPADTNAAISNTHEGDVSKTGGKAGACFSHSSHRKCTFTVCIVFYSRSQCQHVIYNSVFPPCAHHSREKAICIGCGLSVHSGPLSSLVALTMIAAAACVIHVRASCLLGYMAHIIPKHTRTLSAYVNITCMKPGTFSPHTSATVT